MQEEIIIDGVDVSKCYADNKMMKDGLYCFWEGGNCEDNEYCYYKECKRLEQERDELKKACEKCKLFDIEKTNRDLLKQVDELKQENKELKEYSQRMENQRENYYKEYNKLRSALEEIRELLNKKCGIISNAKAVGIINEVLK